MRFTELDLEHFRCFESVHLELEDGVTVIHGLNGSGKTSLLEAAFFALYGTDALDGPTAEAVTTGEEVCEIALGFVHDGERYRLERTLTIREGQVGRHECVLETPEGTIDGVTDVEAQVRSLLRMDSDAFLNCAYVRQGEVNKLIEATPTERQDMIDALLQLGALEEYRDRAGDARLGVEDVLQEQQAVLGDVQTQIERAESRHLPTRINWLESHLASIEDDIERFEANREEAMQDRDAAQETIERFEERNAELSDLEDQIETLETKIAETEDEREGLQDRIEEARERRDTAEERAAELATELNLEGPTRESAEAALERLQTRREEITEAITDTTATVREQSATAETAGERATEAEESATEWEETIADLEETLSETRKEREAVSERVTDLEGTLADAPIHREELEDEVAEREAALTDAQEERASLETALEHAREGVEEAKRLLDRGECPRCGQPVEEASHADALDERRERVAELEAELEDATDRLEEARDARDTAEELSQTLDSLEDAEAELADITTRLEELEAELDRARKQRDDAREAAAEHEENATKARAAAADARERVGELNERKQTVEEDLETAKGLLDRLDGATDAEETIENRIDRRELLADQNDERREQLRTLQEERRELAAEVSEEALETARAQLADAEAYLEGVEEELATLEATKEALQGDIGRFENELSTLEDNRARAAALREEVERLEGLYEETNELEALYMDLRADLRQRNVETLERMLNQTFDLVYQNDSYDRIELSDRYELTVYQKDGDALLPQQLSGGERALFNLSLRCAIYRLLSEGVEGTAPMPPLVLDEPTVFLDAGHVTQLVDLIQAMRSEVGVEQIIVVSHDEELSAAADDLVEVEKDPRTNRSHVSRAVEGVPADD